jgi:DNA-binding MarR family transcriptional regulator
MTARNRIQLAAAFIVQLHRLSSNGPHSWRRAESVGRDINLDGAELELAIRDTEKAGFIQRRADNEGLVILTAKGRAAASPS